MQAVCATDVSVSLGPFACYSSVIKQAHGDLQIDKQARWGDLESDEEESSEEEESEEEEEEAAAREDDEASLADGLASVGGVSSLPSGLETPEVIDLRKAKAGGTCTIGNGSCIVDCVAS